AKESALPLPALLFMWAWRVDRLPWRPALRRALPFAAAALPWAIGELALRRHSSSAAPLEFHAGSFAAAYVHLAQSLAGVEHPLGWLASWVAARPSPFAFALLAVAARGLPERAPAPRAVPGAPAPVPGAVPFALAWLVGFALPVWPVCYLWSSYYYTL